MKIKPFFYVVVPGPSGWEQRYDTRKQAEKALVSLTKAGIADAQISVYQPTYKARQYFIGL